MALDQARGDTVDAEPALSRRGEFARRHRADIAAPLVYLAGCCWLFWPLLRHLRSAAIGGADTSLFTWWLGWTPYAIGHGHDPFLSTWLNAPTGVNAMWNTSVPLLGVLMWPVTAVAGPVASVNLLLLLSPALSAWSAFVAGRVLGLRGRSAFLVGFLYGFSSYTLAQDESGHLHLSFAVFPPLVLALLHRIVKGTISARKGGLLIGVAGVLQVWIGEEMLATAGILTVAVLALLVLYARRRAIVPAQRLAEASCWAAVVAVPLALPALIVQFFGRGHLSSGVPMTPWSTDLLTAITPTPQALVGRLVPLHTMSTLQMGNYDEITGYIGLPLIVLLILSRRRIRTTDLRWCWTGLLVAFVLALGWSVRVAGQDLGIRGPAQEMIRFPLLENVVAVRFSLYVVLFAALLGGAAWDSATEAPARTRQWTVGLVALTALAIVPQQADRFSRISIPPAFASGHLLPGVPDGSTIAVLPWPNAANADAMRWVAVGGLHYKLTGAWGIVAGAHGEGNYGAATPELNNVAYHLAHVNDPPPQGGGTERLLLAEIKDLRAKATALVVGPEGDSARVAAYMTVLLHQIPTATGGVYVFRLRG